MKTNRFVRCFWLIGLLLIPAQSFGSGFAINEQSARAIGMGGAFVAQADDPSAVFYNPAGIMQLEGVQVTVGVSPIIPKASFKSNTENSILNTTVGKKTDLEDSVFFVPNAYATYRYNESIGFGLGVFSNFGLGTDWPDDWEGRFLTGGTEANLTTVSINPVVAFRPFRKFSLSAGPVIQYLDVELKNKRFFASGLPEADSNVEGDDWEWGWNVGALLWLTDGIKLGASYRSRIDHSITGGRLSLTNVPAAVGGDRKFGASANIELPSVLYVGIAWTWNALTLEFDAQWTEWSTYEKLEVNLDNGSTISNRKDWKDVWAYRFGGQYRLNEWLDLRGGIIYDKTPIPSDTLDVLVPSGDRWLFTVGSGIHHNKWTVDLAYNFLLDEDRTFNNASGNTPVGRFTGEFTDIRAHIFALNVSYRF